MITGTVVRIRADKGFCFIRDEAGQEYFAHRSACRTFDELVEGSQVEFISEERPKGPCATRVIAL